MIAQAMERILRAEAFVWETKTLRATALIAGRDAVSQELSPSLFF